MTCTIFHVITIDLHSSNIVELFGYKLSSALLILWFSCVTGYYYNFENILAGFMAAESKIKAIKALIPYIQIYVLIYVSTYSQFYESCALLFYAGLGLFQTYVAGLLNIASTA